MSASPAPRAPAPRALVNVIRSWLQSWSSEVRPSFDGVVSAIGTPVAHRHGTVSVLVVDDNPVNLMMISALMESRGIEPVLAADGAEAVALASELQFDLILMDLQMPILDGLAATSAIRRFESAFGKPAVPVVAYSSMSPGRALLAKYGLNGDLSKPCEDQDLEDCLLQWCPTYRAAPTRGRAA